jgi:hypothetical protein
MSDTLDKLELASNKLKMLLATKLDLTEAECAVIVDAFDALDAAYLRENAKPKDLPTTLDKGSVLLALLAGAVAAYYGNSPSLLSSGAVFVFSTSFFLGGLTLVDIGFTKFLKVAKPLWSKK